MMKKASEELRALGLTAYGIINQNWNREEQQRERYDNGVKPTELCYCNCKQLTSEVEASEVVL